MRKHFLLFAIFFLITSFSIQKDISRTADFPKKVVFVEKMPKHKNVRGFIMAGQSNMAGRGFAEPQDTLPNPRILTITGEGKVIMAEEYLLKFKQTV